MAAMRVGRIPFSAFDRWAARNGVTGADAFARLRRIVHALDAEDVRHLNDKLIPPPSES